MATYRIRAKDPVLVFDIALLKAMADETRSAILQLLCTPHLGEMRALKVSDIADRLTVAISTVSHHLQLLKRVQLVTVERRGKERFYTLDFGQLRRQVGQFHELLKSIDQATEQARGQHQEEST